MKEYMAWKIIQRWTSREN